MSATQDYLALDWIKGEITQTLERAQSALEAVAGAPEDKSNLRSCLTAIHQAHGAFKMIELEGPTQVTAEMEALAEALVNSTPPDKAKAQEILMQVILQMPSYLDKMQREQKDSPDFVVPAVNNLRVARGTAKLDGTRFGTAVRRPQHFEIKPAEEVSATFEKQKGHQTARKIRKRYQQALIALLKRQQPRQNLNVMGKAFSMLVKMCGVSSKGNLFRLALAVVEGISAGAIKLNASTADKFKQVDLELKDLAARGADSLGEISTDLGTELLALVHGAKTETPRIVDVKTLFLDNNVVDLRIEDIHFGLNHQTLSTVSKIIVEELRSVTDKLDLFVRSTEQNPYEIYQLIPLLERIASTLTVVGMADNQASIVGQVEIIKQLENKGLGPSEDQLLEMASAFLEIESSLTLTLNQGRARGKGDNISDVDQAMATVIRETRNTLEIVKDQVVEFISSGFESSKIQTVPENLRSLAGGLRVVNQQRACDILAAAAHYVEKDLLEEQCRPEMSQLDDLADAITSVDYYLERLLENGKDPYVQMIEVAESAIEKLIYAVDGFASEDVADSFFDFEKLRALDNPRDTIEDWNESQIDIIIKELADVRVQASKLKQVYLEEVAAALLIAYENLSVRPNSEIRSVLIAGHEQLILMFDSVAASQVVNPAPEVVQSLGSIDFDALKREQDREEFVDACRELLLKLDGALHSWSQNVSDEMLPMSTRKVLAALLGKCRQLKHSTPDFDVITTVVERMIQLCDLVSAKELPSSRDDLRLFASGRRSIEGRLQAHQASEQQEDVRPLLDEFSNRLEALAISADIPLGVEVETAAEKIEMVENPGTGILPEDDIDFDVLALFLEEAEDLIEGIDQSILEWNENTADISHLDNILRLLHTMKGSATLTGLHSLGEYTHNFETDLMRLQTSSKTLDQNFFASVNERQDELTRRIGVYLGYAKGAAPEKEVSAMQQRKPLAVDSAQTDSTVSDTFTEPVNADSDDATGAKATAANLPEDDVDLDLLPIFIEEAEELLESIDQSILDWSGKPIDHTYLNNLLRHFHTLKGGARLVGLNRLGEYAHNLETFLTGLQQNLVEPSSDFFSSLNRHQDEITRRIAIYKKMVEGSAGSDEVSSLSNSSDFSDSLIAGDATDFAEVQDLSATIRSPAHDEEAAERVSAPSQEIVRVSAELLDELVSLAGETSITRARIEQQITDFGESLEEMEETIVRIREQVRRLEIEAESRETVFRSQSEHADAGFDELELDRYTMLQEISRSLNEGSSDMMDLKDTLRDKSRDAETLLHQQARLGSELQEGLTRTRMVSFARLIPRLRRIVRQISVELGKSVKFDAFNIEGELDRSVLERIVAPLEHMLRNAVDHGIESQRDRIAANKAELGRVSLRLSREGGYVVLVVSDDGGGIDVDAVKKKALELGLIDSAEQVTDQEAMQFIVDPGFSTAQELTQISGRGVGMDVVNSEIKQLGGKLQIESTLGVGTEFSIRIPFTVSINRALMVVVQEETYAVPLNTIEGIVRVSPYELEAYYQTDAPMFEYAGQPYKLIYTGNLLSKSKKPSFEGQTTPLPVILARGGDLSVALQVDKVIGSREVVVKALGRQFDKVGGISGATVLGDGSVVVILDVLALVQNVEVQAEQFVSNVPLVDETAVKTVMIVDDSVTVRKVTSRLMERQGWTVVTAKDGLDAVEQLQDIYPDIVLLDIEMPKMDGFEVLRAVRRDARLKHLPIMMITSRTGEKHKQQAFGLGVNAYLGKPFQEADLISSIEEVLAEMKA